MRIDLFIKKCGCVLVGTFLYLGVTACGKGTADLSPAVKQANIPNGVEAIYQAEIEETNESLPDETGSSDGLTEDIKEAIDNPTDETESIKGSTEDIGETKEDPMDDAGSAGSTTEGVDVDLTIMSGTMVYSEVYNMVYYPEDYIGKKVKMNGLFSSYHDEATGKDYFACIISDATACCSQGIEFVLTDDYKYPDDYPKEGGNITVAGVFDTYMEGDGRYCTLRDAQLF